MPNCQCKYGFTLAEVLITLGIIGVVAAITIPVLTGNYRKNVVETSLKKYYSILNQALERSQADNGSAVNWEWKRSTYGEEDDAFFKKYFAPYILTANKQQIQNSITNNFYKIYASDNIGGESQLYTDNRRRIWYQLPDGGAVLFSQESLHNKQLGNFSVVLPTGANPERLVAGKDVFIFSVQLSQDGTSVSLAPNSFWGWTCSNVIEQKDDFIRGCKSYTSMNPENYCTMLIYCNGWKIPDDYPIRF